MYVYNDNAISIQVLVHIAYLYPRNLFMKKGIDKYLNSGFQNYFT